MSGMDIQQNLDNLHDYFAGRADASCEPGDDRYRGNAEMGLLSDVEAVEAEVKRLTASISEGERFRLEARSAEALDAERYRYLRNAAGMYAGDEDGPTVCSGVSDLFEYHFGPEVDEVVDEAMARWKAAGCPLPKEAA